MTVMTSIDRFDGEYHFLSNFFPLGSLAVTSEHWFQAMKTTDFREQLLVLGQPTPGKAKRVGRKVSLRPDWDDIKVDVMSHCVVQKFMQHPELAALLEATGDAELIEGNIWNDTFWGVCRGKGENNLGKILMEVRSARRTLK
jgi:ribA/ribD-fused uncharacterized protein